MGLALIAISITKRHVVHVAHNHDDWAWFRIWFAIATVTASIVLNLGVFALLVVSHMVLDVIKYRSKHNLSWYWTFAETMREGLVDIFFISLGLLLGVAFHHAVAIGGLGRVARLEVLLLNMFLRVAPRFKIAEHLLEIFLYWKHHFEKPFIPHEPLSKSEKGLLFATIATTVAIVLVPYVTDITWLSVGQTIKYELTPRLEFGITHTLETLQSE
jgi:hypothetical protein